jgi:hypothetical protein
VPHHHWWLQAAAPSEEEDINLLQDFFLDWTGKHSPSSIASVMQKGKPKHNITTEQ